MFNECRHIKNDGLRCRSESFHCETWTAKSRASETCSQQLSGHCDGTELPRGEERYGFSIFLTCQRDYRCPSETYPTERCQLWRAGILW